MEKLKESFRRHGLSYTLIKRNDKLCIYGVSGTYTDNILHFEVMLIRIRDDQYGHREGIPSDEEFGKSKRDRHFQKLVEAEAYFARWTASLMQGVKEKDKVIPKRCHWRTRPAILDKNSIKNWDSIKNRNKDYDRITMKTKKH